MSPEANGRPPHDYQLRSKRAWLGLLGWLALTFVVVVMIGGMMDAVSKTIPLAGDDLAIAAAGKGYEVAVHELPRDPP